MKGPTGRHHCTPTCQSMRVAGPLHHYSFPHCSFSSLFLLFSPLSHSLSSHSSFLSHLISQCLSPPPPASSIAYKS
ncbi:uncharacterized protein BDW43DRAFT_265328 [Aspergillus alliaceus]|uniref:uncharacterized protein n=1 Tax=Petromyces alliaceus TaxID=209559 RepID=UPI0012A3F764|nr:uncharacterized protein BDW43DRAFT_265328 [Aspergillus alliaceus]KAB8237376.1 hypothetical protein BDW43DRAFT_265328 [Aspergillus alliaceus]